MKIVEQLLLTYPKAVVFVSKVASKDNLPPYFLTHSDNVGSLLLALEQPDHIVTAGILHDVIEDTSSTYEDIKNNFGQQVADLVLEVTKAGYNVFPNLHSREAVIIKFADRLSNLVHMEGWSEERIEKYLEKSRFWIGKNEIDEMKNKCN